MTYIISFIIAYLIGSISGSIIVSRVFFNEDIREKGSGNAGTTNTVRIYGVKFGFFTMLVDILKATLVVFLAYEIFGTNEMYIAGMAVVIGHIFPIYYGFRGGKGVATVIGANIFINPLVVGYQVLCFIILNISTGIVAFSSIIAVLVGLVYLLITGVNNNFYLVMAIVHFVVITYAHRSNIKRMINGTELKINLINELFKKK